MTNKHTQAHRWLLLACLPFAVGQSLAAEYWLQTGTTTISPPGATAPITMWGYALCGAGATAPATCAGTVKVPGEPLVVPPGEGLKVHLQNNLAVPTSLVIAGQSLNTLGANAGMLRPVWTDGLSGPRSTLAQRVRSFTNEVAPGASADYVWPDLKPGTYLYQSGTEPQVQVQMGLYGALTKDAATGGIAYQRDGIDIAYASQVVLVYSELDPVLHQAVAAGSYGGSGPTSTLEYQPKFFLINGQPYPDVSLVPAATLAGGQPTLLRLLNAGLKTHVPTINGQYWQMIAEDGNAYPYAGNPRQQYTAFLTAGKTLDVLWTPATPAGASGNVRYAVFDSRAYDTNAGAQGGGYLAYFDVTPAANSPPVFDSLPVTSATVGVAYAYAAHATDPEGSTVSYSLNAGFPAGMTINANNGLINWLPATSGSFPVSVRAFDGSLASSQSFAIVVVAPPPVNHAPVARNDSYTAVAHASASGLVQTVTAPGVLANDSDPDGDPLHAGGKTGSPLVTLNANGSFSLAPTPTAGTVSFGYQALDTANAPSTPATVAITVIANRAPSALADAFSVPRCTFRQNNACRTGTGFYVAPSLNLVSNDTDLDTATLDAANQTPLVVARVRSQTAGTNGGSTTAVTTSIGGRVTISGGSISYVPPYNFAGTDVFQYRVKDKLGKESGSTTNNTNNLGQGWATVTITVQ